MLAEFPNFWMGFISFLLEFIYSSLILSHLIKQEINLVLKCRLSIFLGKLVVYNYQELLSNSIGSSGIPVSRISYRRIYSVS